MCRACGCGAHGGAARVELLLAGCGADTARAAERALLGLPGVLYAHVHAREGRAWVDCVPERTDAAAMAAALAPLGIAAEEADGAARRGA